MKLFHLTFFLILGIKYAQSNDLTDIGTKSRLEVIEYRAPQSPNKINRTRIKAIPRFGQRRTSFSASESEDDNRKTYIRQRNDSVRPHLSPLLFI